MTIKLQTYVGDIIRTMTTAGQIVEIPPVDHRGLSRLRSASLQVAAREGIGVELRTIDGSLFARRTDFPIPTATMPGLEPIPPTENERTIATLEFMRPWKDNVNYVRINEAIDVAIGNITRK